MGKSKGPGRPKDIHLENLENLEGTALNFVEVERTWTAKGYSSIKMRKIANLEGTALIFEGKSKALAGLSRIAHPS